MVTEKYSKNQPLPFNQTRPQKYVQYIICVVFLKLYLDASKDMAEEYFLIDFFVLLLRPVSHNVMSKLLLQEKVWKQFPGRWDTQVIFT